MEASDRGFRQALKKIIRGDVYDDPVVLGMYATDASVYQMTPKVVVCPRDEEDVVACMSIANQYRVPILARGGGTSLAGQTVTEGIVLDFSKYMNAIVSISGKTAVVQPGVIRHELNKILKSKNLEFAPDPATSTRATIGGMIANNSSGTKSILYGKTSDHVLSLKVLLADGRIIHTGQLSQEILQHKLDSHDPDKALYKGMMDIVRPLTEEIEANYPKTMRRVGGYAFDDFKDSGYGDLSRILMGSEGTLGIILEATLNLVDLPIYKGVSVVQFDQALEAIRAVTTMVQYNPAAVEVLSRILIGYSRKNIETANMCDFLKGDPDAIQMIEFYGDDPEEILQRAEAMHADLKAKGFGYAHDFYPEGETYHHVWGIRERGLGLMLGEPADKKGVPVIEDAAIPLQDLYKFIKDVIDICHQRGVEVDYYAHASVGVIHIKPILDLREQEDIEHFKHIADEVFERVKFYKGSWSSEHGDGIVRSSYLEKFYGPEIYQGFVRTKELFDPHHLLNPGKIVDPPPMDSHLRYGPSYHDLPFNAVYQYREQRNFYTAVHQCSGLGACRKVSGGTMCPSFMVTKDEVDSTRGRANALRLAMSGQLPDGLANKSLPQVMDLCLSCKACKAECPSSVDMARLKSELQQHHHDLYGASFKEKMVARSPDIARKMTGRKAKLINALQSNAITGRLAKSILGLHMQRQLPSYAETTWTTVQKQSTSGGDQQTPDVILLADTYTECHHPQSGIAAIRLLEHLGQRVLLLNPGCCQRPRISHGFLKEAQEHLQPALEKLKPWLSREIPIAVLEPGCASAWTDDIPDLINDTTLAESLKKIRTFESLLLDVMQQTKDAASRFRPIASEVIVHGHCHQKSIFGMRDVQSIFAHWPDVKYTEIDSGCCGMAGSFGYEAKHYDLSKKMAERVLIPAVNDHPHALVIANGFSCRHQIEDFSGRRSVHIAEAFEVVTQS